MAETAQIGSSVSASVNSRSSSGSVNARRAASSIPPLFDLGNDDDWSRQMFCSA
jgi:hypothetical protein